MSMKRAQPVTTTETTPLTNRQQLGVADAARPSLLDDERGTRVVLPADYPAWRRDNLSLSARAKAMLAKFRPYVIRVFTFWDHRQTSLALDEGTVDVDASGSYRIT